MRGGRVLYASFATRHLSGGVDVHRSHVAMLRAAGVDAALWLPTASVPGWMGAVEVVNGLSVDLGPDDLVVYPETPVVAGLDPAPGARKVIFNQNHFYTYATWADRLADYPGWDPAPSVWVASEESRAVLAAMLPRLPLDVVPPPVDPEVFRPAASRSGLAMLPKKRPHEAMLLRRLFEVDPRTASVPVRVLADATRAEVAASLASSIVFVALSHTDSVGLPVAEALSAGCLVVGYDGGGGVGLFDAPGAWRVPEQRPLLLADRAAALLDEAATLTDLAEQNRCWASSRFAPSAVAPALLAAVARARARAGRAAVALHPSTELERLAPGFTKSG